MGISKGNFFKILFIFREEEREIEGEKHGLVTSHVPPTGDLTHRHPGVPGLGMEMGDFSVGRPGLSPLSHTSQGFKRNF